MARMDTLVIAFVLAMIRFGPVLLLPSITPFTWAPLIARVALTLSLAVLAVVVATPHGSLAGLGHPLHLAMLGARELLLGLALSFAVVLPSAALNFAGRLIDLQAGFGAASLLNPATQAPEALVGRTLGLMSVAVFFGTGLDRTLVRGLIASVAIIPLGGAYAIAGPETLLAMLGSQFLLGFTVVAPVMIGLFAIDLAVTLASRSMPQANVYFLALPLKIGAALLLLAVTLRYAPPTIERLYRDAFVGSSHLVTR